jgi:hypothetical protein
MTQDEWLRSWKSECGVAVRHARQSPLVAYPARGWGTTLTCCVGSTGRAKVRITSIMEGIRRLGGLGGLGGLGRPLGGRFRSPLCRFDLELRHDMYDLITDNVGVAW